MPQAHTFTHTHTHRVTHGGRVRCVCSLYVVGWWVGGRLEGGERLLCMLSYRAVLACVVFVSNTSLAIAVYIILYVNVFISQRESEQGPIHTHDIFGGEGGRGGGGMSPTTRPVYSLPHAFAHSNCCIRATARIPLLRSVVHHFVTTVVLLMFSPRIAIDAN